MMEAIVSNASSKVFLENCDPILNVKDFRASLTYYENVLGFKREPWVSAGATFGQIKRDNASIYLAQGEQGRAATWIWIGCHAAEAVYDEIMPKGAIIHQPLTNYSWALELRARDPDGHVLRFGSDAKSDQPFADAAT